MYNYRQTYRTSRPLPYQIVTPMTLGARLTRSPPRKRGIAPAGGRRGRRFQGARLGAWVSAARIIHRWPSSPDLADHFGLSLATLVGEEPSSGRRQRRDRAHVSAGGRLGARRPRVAGRNDAILAQASAKGQRSRAADRVAADRPCGPSTAWRLKTRVPIPERLAAAIHRSSSAHERSGSGLRDRPGSRHRRDQIEAPMQGLEGAVVTTLRSKYRLDRCQQPVVSRTPTVHRSPRARDTFSTPGIGPSDPSGGFSCTRRDGERMAQRIIGPRSHDTRSGD